MLEGFHEALEALGAISGIAIVATIVFLAGMHFEKYVSGFNSIEEVLHDIFN